jgi:hypothetical protein
VALKKFGGRRVPTVSSNTGGGQEVQILPDICLCGGARKAVGGTAWIDLAGTGSEADAGMFPADAANDRSTL